MKSKHPIALLAGWLALIASSPESSSQTTTRDAEEPVRMSPFEVSAAQDVGYQGGNTTSGSRLNTSLKDTPAAIQVITQELMDDFAMNSLEEMFAYSASTLIGNSLETRENSNPGFAYSTVPNVQIRVRGLEASAGVDFFDAITRIDSYNTERLEISSGPNSILFGFGNPGGLVNVMTKRARVDRNRTGIRLRFGSWNLQRYELDHNQVVVPGKLAFRLNGLYEDADGWRTNDFRNARRGALSMRFNPWDRTSLIINGEKGEIRRHINLPQTGEDQFKLWEASGSPVTDQSVWTAADRASGINRSGVVSNIYVTNADGSAPFLIPTRNAVGSRLLVTTVEDFRVPAADRAGRSLLHPDVLPVKYSVYGPGSIQYADFERLMINLDQQITENIDLNLAYENATVDSNDDKVQNGSMVFQGDPNLTIPNPDGVGSPIPNPNAGKLFNQVWWNPGRIDIPQEVFRAALSGRFDLGRFGTHNVAGMYENSDRLFAFTQVQTIFVDDNNVPINRAATPEHRDNWVSYRHYVTPGDFSTYDAFDARETVSVTRNGVDYHSRTINRALPAAVNRGIETGLLVTQSYFFDDRLVVTAGLRKDRLVFGTQGNSRYTATDPEVVSGERIVNELRRTDEIVKTDIYKPTTKSIGGVYHINSLLSVFYNTSDNTAQPNAAHLILPDLTLPQPVEGVTFDYGFMLNLFDGRFFLRATAYETSQEKKTASVTFNGLRAPTDRILNALLANDLITAEQFEEHSVFKGNLQAVSDEVNSGYEVSAWYNPGKGFTAQFNYSYTETDRSRIGPEFEGWFERESAFWFSNPGVGGLEDPDTGTTIDENVAFMPQYVDQQRVLNSFGFGIRPHKANVSARYSLSEGRLKGAFFGGGVRWGSSALIGRFREGRDADGNVIFGDSVKGAETFTMDGFVGYRTRIGLGGHDTNLTVQLNVMNLTDEGEWTPLRFNNDFSAVSRMLLITPREYRVSVSLDF